MEFAEMLLKFKPLWGNKTVQALRQLYERRKQDGSAQQLYNIILAHYIRQFGELPEEDNTILLEPPSPKQAWGDYQLGHVQYGKQLFTPFGLREEEFIRNAIVVGTPGSGKTNTASLLAWHFLKKNKPFLVFDWKRSWRDLAACKEGQDMLVFTVGRMDLSPFYFNPLIPPPGRKATEWMRALISVMGHAYFLGQGCFDILRRSIDMAYRDYGVYDRPVETWPTFQTVLENMYTLKVSKKSADWLASTQRAVEWLNFPDFCYTINVPKFAPIEKLFEHTVILELDSMMDADKVFFVESLLMWYFYYRLSQKKEREKFWHATIVEEAHHVFLKNKQEAEGEETVTDRMIRMFREHNESLILIDQHPSLISVPALGDTYCTIAHNLKHEHDVVAAGAAMLMPRGQRKYLGKLEVGQAIVKLQGRYMNPFLISVPPVNVPKGAVDDEILKSLMFSRVERLKPFPKPPNGEEEAAESSKNEKLAMEPMPPPIQAKEKEIRIMLPGELLVIISESEKALLLDINRNFAIGFRDRYVGLRWSKHKAETVRASLIQRGLIEEVVVPDVTAGRKHLYQFTPKGTAVMQALGEETRTTWRKGGLEHQYYEMQLGLFAQDFGYKVTREHQLGGGKSVDVDLLRLPNTANYPEHPFLKTHKHVALEFETGKATFHTNVVKCLEADYDLVVSIGLNKKVEEKIQSDLAKAGLHNHPRVMVTNVRDFMLIGKKEE